MAHRNDWVKDNFISQATVKTSVTNPTDGQVINTFTAAADGIVLGIDIGWSGAANAKFLVNGYPFSVGALGGGQVEVIGRSQFSAGDVVSITSDGAHTGTASAAIIYADL